MKKFFMMAVMAAAALTASAQKGDFYITPHLGLGYAHVTDFTDYEGNISGIVGADFEIMMTNTLGLSAGLDSFKDGINKFMLAVPVGVSYTFQDTPIVVDLRANIPTGKMFDGDGKLLDFVVSVGYCFDL